MTQLRLHVGFHLIHEHFQRRPGLECSASAGVRRRNHCGEHCKHHVSERILIIFMKELCHAASSIFQVKNELKLSV